jgi:hypothetical protein
MSRVTILQKTGTFFAFKNEMYQIIDSTGTSMVTL